jgi:hypothetical protein
MQCLERITPNNRTTFIISITNNKNAVDTIESVKDKLPLGFVYVDESSQLNGNPIADSVFVTVTNIGNSEEIVWEPSDSWSVSAQGTLTISFDAVAGNNSLNGTNLNEVVITPTQIPIDSDALSTSTEITVAQVCESQDVIDDTPVDDDSTPQTGLFDNSIIRIVLGLGIIVMGVIIYNSNQGNQLANILLDSKAYHNAEMTTYKIFKPKKYFEEKILERRKRKR